MPETLTVLIPHRLGKDEALRRLKHGLGKIEEHFRSVFVVQEQTWIGDTVQFHVRALGHSVHGTIEVGNDHVRLDVLLPWLIARLVKNLQRMIERQGTDLLEKK
jgi:putative polyhydroxyalkanoic acid system protein